MFAVKLIKNKQYPLDVPENVSVKHGDMVIVLTEKGEEVAQAYPAAAEYREDGQVEMWNIKVLFPALLKIVQDQQKEIEYLKNAINKEQNV